MSWPGVLLGLTGACVSTELDESSVDGVCVDTAAVAARSDAIALIGTELTDDTFVICSAAVIAPRLLLTSLTCVAVPADVDRALEENLSLDSASCTTPAGSPQEDGSLATRFAGLAEPRSIEVYFPPDAIEARLPVIDVAVASGNSGCTDNLALLVLDESLPVSPVALRLNDPAPAGEAVVVADLELIDGSFQPRATVAHVAVSPRLDSRPALPARALTLDHPACDFGLGGAVFAEQTGALIGLVPPSVVGGCSIPERPTVGLRLAPFRRMLLDTARNEAATTLRLESTFGNATVPIPLCGDEPRERDQARAARRKTCCTAHPR